MGPGPHPNVITPTYLMNILFGGGYRKLGLGIYY